MQIYVEENHKAWALFEEGKVTKPQLTVLRFANFLQRVGIAGDNHQPGGVPVQPMGRPVYKNLTALTVVVGQKIAQRIVMMSRPRVGCHPGGLVDHQKVCIFVKGVWL